MGAGSSRVCGVGGGGAAALVFGGGAEEPERRVSDAPGPRALSAREQRAAAERQVQELRPRYKKLFKAYERDGVLGRAEFRPFYRDVLMAASEMPKEDADAAATSLYQGVEKAAAVFQSYDTNYDGRVSFREFWEHPHTHASLMPRTPAAARAARLFFDKWERRPVSKVRRAHVTAREPRDKFVDTAEGRRRSVAAAGGKKKKKKKKKGAPKKAFPKTPRWGSAAGERERGPGPSVVERGDAPAEPLDFQRWSSEYRGARPQAGGSAAILPARRPRTASEAPGGAYGGGGGGGGESQLSRRRAASAYGPDRVRYMKSIPVGGRSGALDGGASGGSGTESGGPSASASLSSLSGSARSRAAAPPRRAVDRYITPGGPAFPYDGADEKQLKEDTRKAMAESLRIQQRRDEAARRERGRLEARRSGSLAGEEKWADDDDGDDVGQGLDVEIPIGGAALHGALGGDDDEEEESEESGDERA